jgi:predicted nucleic acid-binding protein
MSTVFLDTVGMLAVWDEDDQWHSAAQSVFAELVRTRARMVTTSLIFHECGNAVARGPFRNDVVEFRQEMAAFNDLVIPTADDETEAWEHYRRGVAGDAGIVDHISFTVMRRLGIKRAFTNDKHFNAAGFEVLF